MSAATVMILPMTDDLVPRQGRGLWVDSFWRSESIVTVLRPNSSGLRPIARYQLAQSQFVRPARASISVAVMAPLASWVTLLMGFRFLVKWDSWPVGRCYSWRAAYIGLLVGLCYRLLYCTCVARGLVPPLGNLV